MPKHKDSTTASVENKDKPAFEDAALGFVYKSLSESFDLLYGLWVIC